MNERSFFILFFRIKMSRGNSWSLSYLRKGQGPSQTKKRSKRIAFYRKLGIFTRWQGLRCRPLGQPAPLLEQVAPGLLLLSGHYRNGVLLAPASADWALRWIEGNASTR